MAQARGSHTLIYLLVAIPISLIFVWELDVVSMEGIIALGARRMLATGDWFVPRLYGELYAFKPALAYWLAAIPEYLLGWQTEFTLRLPTAVCGIALGLVICQTIGRLINPRCGLWCALATVTSVLFVEQVRSASFDVPLALGTGVAILFACRNLAIGQVAWHGWLVVYAGLCVGFLAKGTPAIAIYGSGLFIACLSLNRLRMLWSNPHLLGCASFVLVGSGYLGLSYREAGAAAFNDHIGELLTRSGQWSWETLGLRLLTPLMIFVAFLPFSAILIIVGLRPHERKLTGIAKRLRRAAWAFMLTGTIVFLLAGTDDMRYYLPLIAPMAMLCGIASESFFPIANKRTTRTELVAQRPQTLLGLKLGRRTPIVLATSGLIWAVVYATAVQPSRISKRSERMVASAFAPYIPDDAVVYVASRDSQSSLCFYLNHETRRWELVDPPPSNPIYLVLVGNERNILATRTDVKFTPLRSVKGPRAEDTYTLGIANHVPANDPIGS
jgi:4-amino-4-deoxy-L-arabinose transferase-like glycosyltransferase